MSVPSQSVEEWRKDIQDYIPRILDSEQPNGEIVNAQSFREQVFRKACLKVLCDEKPMSIDHTMPEWNQSIEQWTHKRDAWQVNQTTRDRLEESEHMCMQEIDWPVYGDVDMEKSLNMLERPLHPSTARIFPKWSLQDRAKKLPVMKVPKVNNPAKDSLSFSSPPIDIESDVYNQLSMLKEDLIEHKVNDGVEFPLRMDNQCFVREVLTREQLYADEKKEDSFSDIDEYLLEYQSPINSEILSKSTSEDIEDPPVEKTDQVSTPMRIDPLTSIRRVNDYSGTKRSLDGFFMNRQLKAPRIKKDEEEIRSRMSSNTFSIPEFQHASVASTGQFFTDTASTEVPCRQSNDQSMPGTKKSRQYAIVPDRQVLSPGLRSLAYPEEQWKLSLSGRFSAEANVNDFVAMRKRAQQKKPSSNEFCELQGLVEKHQFDE